MTTYERFLENELMEKFLNSCDEKEKENYEAMAKSIIEPFEELENIIKEMLQDPKEREKFLNELEKRSRQK